MKEPAEVVDSSPNSLPDEREGLCCPSVPSDIKFEVQRLGSGNMTFLGSAVI